MTTSDAASASLSETPIQQFSLRPENELRFEVEHGNTVKIKLVDGTAECFGHELAPEKEYVFTGQNSCIFTWHGCNVIVEGQCHSYIADETPNTFYINAHVVLQEQRDVARSTAHPGPRAMVVGATDSGKTSLCSVLCNYATRKGEHITFVDLDVGQGAITIPAMLSAAALNAPIDVEDGFSSITPLVTFFGTASPGDNPKLYKKQMEQLASQLLRRDETDVEARAGGWIINTCGWVDGQGFELLVQSIEIFAPDYIFVIAHERLYNDLQVALRSANIKAQVVKFPRSGGVVTRDMNYRRKSRMSKIREYFYGRLGGLSPHSAVVDFKDVMIYRIGAGHHAPITALPIGFESTADPLKLVLVTPSIDLMHSILCVSLADTPEKILESNLAGYLYVTEVSLEKKKLTVLSPSAGTFPGKILLSGTLKWLE